MHSRPKKTQHCCVTLKWNFYKVGSVDQKLKKNKQKQKKPKVQNLGTFSAIFLKNTQSEQNWVLS